MARELFLYGDFGLEIRAKDFYDELKTSKEDTLVRLSSAGGDLSEAVAIANMIVDRGNVDIAIDGLAASAATVVACAGRKVTIDAGGSYMVHGPSLLVIQANADRLRKVSDFLDNYSDQMREFYRLRPQINQSKLEEWLKNGEDNWFTASQALEHGFVDEVRKTPFLELSARLLNFIPRTMRSSTVQESPQTATPSPVPAAVASQPAASPPAAVASPPAASPPAAVACPPAASPPVDHAAQIVARNSKIRERAKPFMHLPEVQELVYDYLTHVDRPVEQFTDALVGVLAKGTQPVVSYPSVQGAPGKDEVTKLREGVTNWLTMRMRLPERFGSAFQAGDPGEFRGMTLVNIAAECLERAGVRTKGRFPHELVTEALQSNRLFGMQTASDFAVLMENVMHKTLLAAYNTEPYTWSRWCYSVTVDDFRNHIRYRTGLLPRLKTLSEDGEIPFIRIPDGERYMVSVDENGVRIGLSRKAIVDNDLNTFSDLVAQLGASARRSEELDAINLLMSNPVLPDGNPFFHSSRGNVATAAAPSEASFIDVMLKFAAFKDIAGEDYLDLSPDFMLCGKSVEPVARRINASQSMVATNMSAGVVNVVQNTYSEIISTARLGPASTAWYSFVRPSRVRSFEMVHLSGAEAPQISQEQPFNTTGVQWRIVHVWGVAPADPRGCIYNAGA
jgi:ATP-dependent protease ClpP protease subunit